MLCTKVHRAVIIIIISMFNCRVTNTAVIQTTNIPGGWTGDEVDTACDVTSAADAEPCLLSDAGLFVCVTVSVECPPDAMSIWII